MEDTTLEIVGILLAAVLLFIIPLILIADRTDDISQLAVQTVTAEFVNQVVKSGQITSDNYQRFISTLYSSGNTYDIDMEVKILDETTSKMVTMDPANKGAEIGNNSYYSLFTSQVEDKIGIASVDGHSGRGKLVLKQGDQISISVKNSSKTLSQALKNFYYDATGDSLHIIVATSTGTISINGATGIT